LIVDYLSPPFASWPEALATFFGGQQLRHALVCGPSFEAVQPLGIKIAEGVGRGAFLNFDDLIDSASAVTS
jgi:hypothetical protein